MKWKLSLLLVPVFLVACSSSNETAVYDNSPAPTSEVSDPKPYSVEKQNYVQSCIETSDESFCSCQFDVMDPVLSSSVGSNWSTKAMEEDYFGTYVSAVETAVSQCS